MRDFDGRLSFALRRWPGWALEKVGEIGVAKRTSHADSPLDNLLPCNTSPVITYLKELETLIE